MLGFTLPLFVILGLEAVVGTLLLCPKPINQPAISLARLSATQVGATVFHTLVGVLLLLLASPVYDGVRLYYQVQQRPEQATSIERSEQEARTLLSFTLTFSCLAVLFFLRKLGRVLGQLDRQALNEAALLKQVKGLQSEYNRVVDSQAGAPAAPSVSAAGAASGGKELSEGEVAELRRLLADLEKMNSELNARAEKATKAHGEAERNLAALKTQSRGLENEYDRLLAEYDELKRRMQRAGLDSTVGDGGGSGAGGYGSKKDE